MKLCSPGGRHIRDPNSASLLRAEWQSARPTRQIKSGQQGHSTTGLALSVGICFPQCMQFELLFLRRKIQRGNKRRQFSRLMSGQGESHGEKVDICVYSSHSSRTKSPPSAPAEGGAENDFNWPRWWHGSRRNMNMTAFLKTKIVWFKVKMQLISFLCKFGLLCCLIVINIIPNFTLCHNWISVKLHGTDIYAMIKYLYLFLKVGIGRLYGSQQSWDTFSDYPGWGLKKTHRKTLIS